MFCYGRSIYWFFGFLLMLIGIAGSILPVLARHPHFLVGTRSIVFGPIDPFDWTFIIITGLWHLLFMFLTT